MSAADRIQVRVRDSRLGIVVEIIDRFAKPKPGETLANGLLHEEHVTKRPTFNERRLLQNLWAQRVAAREAQP